MLAAVLPQGKGTLNALFEKERKEAADRIIQQAATNEMQLLLEMAGYVCVYIYVCVCMYVYMYTNTPLLCSSSQCLYAYMHTCVCVYMH